MSHHTKLFILGAFLFLGMAADILAAGGILDTTFNGNGKSVFNIENSATSGGFANVVVIGGNKFLVVGSAIVGSSSYYGVTLSRFNSDGSLDTSFGVGGKVITDAGVTSEGIALVLQSDGKIVVAAEGGNSPNRMTVVLRYTADGMLDTTFGTNGVFLSSVMKLPRDIGILGDNKILIAGDSDVPNFSITQVLKLNANGSLDTTFGNNGIASSTYFSGSDTDKMAIQSDGKIVVSGRNLFTVPKWLVHRFNTDGSPDATFDGDGIREINASGSMYPGGMALQTDGKIVVGGFGTVPQVSDTQLMLTRLNTDGSTDSSFGGGMVFRNLTSDYDRTYDMAIQSDGKILIAGHQDETQPMIARFDSTGAIDTTFDFDGVALLSPGFNIPAIALQGSNVVAIGPVTPVFSFVARIDLAGTIITNSQESFGVGKNDEARDIAIQPDGKIVAAGVSVLGNGQIVSVARILPTGSLDTSFGTGGLVTVSDGTFSCEAFAVDIQPDGKIVVAGRGSQQMSFSYYTLFLARLNADGSLDNTFGSGGKVIFTNNPGNIIGYDMDIQPDGKILVGGKVERLVGDGIYEHDMMVARFTTNGSNDGLFIFYNNFNYEDARALTFMPNGKIVIAGTHLLRLNGDMSVDATFSSVPVPLSFRATDVKVQADGKPLVSGSTGPDFALARYNTNASTDMTFGINGQTTLDFGGADGANAIYLDPNGDIVAGGSTLGGNPSYKKFALARFKPNGSPDPTFGIGGKVITDFGGDAYILGLTRQSDGKILAAGTAKMSVDRDYAVARYLQRSAPFDFDGDGKTDISIFRPSVGEWWISRSGGGNYAAQFGSSTDRITPGDFTGDGKTDIAFFRPATGAWFVLRSEDGSYYSHPFGISGDIPAVGDFDLDGKADQGVFRPSNSTWYIHRSSDNGAIIQQFGQPGDVPVAADYDGDGRSDIAIYRPESGQWWILRSTAGLIAFQFGNSSDKPVQGDYTGDGRADAAVFRPSTGEWFVLRSEDFSYYSFPYGISGDIPSPGDYDGDGKIDAAVFRPSNSTWFVHKSTGGHLIQTFGQSGDLPAPGAFVP